MSSESKNTIALLGTDLYYEVYGEGIPVLLIHGWGVDHRLMSGCMEPVFSDHPAHFMRIYVDLPGMGKSKAGESIRCSDEVLDVLLAFIDAMLPGQTLLLAGESYGGYLARALLQERSAQILGLLLICPAVFPGYRKGDVPPPVVLEKDSAFLASLTDTERTYFTFITVIQNEKNWKRFKADVYESLLHRNSEFLDHRLDGAFSSGLKALEKPFGKPSLILVGRQDAEVGYRDQFALLDDFPRASFAVLDKTGHNLQIEQDRLFSGLVSEWLDRVIAEK